MIEGLTALGLLEDTEMAGKLVAWASSSLTNHFRFEVNISFGLCNQELPRGPSCVIVLFVVFDSVNEAQSYLFFGPS